MPENSSPLSSGTMHQSDAPAPVQGTLFEGTSPSPGGMMARTDPTRPAVGPSIRGYRVDREIARGGMGCVLAGWDLTLDREVAIKTLLPGANAERFVVESKITAQLPHPGIPPVYALGTLEDGSPFLAMKLIHGRTLADELKQTPDLKIEWPRLLQVFEQIAQAVGFAHSRGIIHRDLKPANVMVGEFGEVQVMDWGLAKKVAEGDQPSTASVPVNEMNATLAGMVLGTPSYMAPEQARGEPLDARADVFALGGILNAILTNQPIFAGTTVRETVQQAASGDTALPLQRLDRSGAEGEVIAIVQQCLAVERAHRPADGRAVARLVSDYRRSVEARLRRAETETAASEARAIEQAKRRRAMVFAGGVIAAVLLLGTAVSLLLMLRAQDAEKATREQLTKTQHAEEATREQLKKTQKAEAIAGEQLKKTRNALNSLCNLAERYMAANKLELAVPLFEESLKMLKSELGTSHPSTLTTMSSLAIGYESMGKIDLAMQLRQEVLILRRAVLGAEHPETLAAMHNVALGYLDAGRHNEALPLFLEAVQGIEKGRFEHAAADLIVPNLLRCLDELQRFDEAEIWRRKWLPVLKQRSEVESPAYASELATWGLSLLQRQRWAEAEAVLTECLAIRQKKRPNIWNTFNTMSLLGGSLLGQKKHTEARELLLQGYEGMKAREKTIPPQGSTRIPEALDRLIQLCEATDKPEEAKKYRELRNEYRERLPMPKEKP